jgi:hypothetical protein
VRWAIPDASQVDFIGHNLRAQDAYEVMASDGLGPVEAVELSWQLSTPTDEDPSRECRIIQTDEGLPLGICGVAAGGVIWMLCTDDLFRAAQDRRQFVRDGKRWVDLCVQRYGALSNWVHAKNVDSIRWLLSMGFTVHAPEPHGPSGQLFCYFERWPE